MKKLLIIFGLSIPTIFFAQQEEIKSKCDLPANYKEPKPDQKIQSKLKRGDATIEDLRKHISIDNDCDIKDVIFLRFTEQLGNGMYIVCVKGKEMKYKRMGTVFMKSDENPFDTVK